MPDEKQGIAALSSIDSTAVLNATEESNQTLSVTFAFAVILKKKCKRSENAQVNSWHTQVKQYVFLSQQPVPK
jgi:hypothetical protein